ncbi:ribbon-helix-helix domain-containing protein [Swaminathania salitolerans]|uniref:ribbon-helix-helix domain-containing protein n=1 Tax=Swaminathania salitolerans TaxID=182838 RepID=UPI0011BDB3EF|nr:ribbon-helix-helix domain-containing protein [Swaminathania salitolerans]
MTAPKTALVKRSFTLSGHRTSIALEPEFWSVLEEMSAGRSMAALVAQIDSSRSPDRPLASSLRLAVLRHLRSDLCISK